VSLIDEVFFGGSLEWPGTCLYFNFKLVLIDWEGLKIWREIFDLKEEILAPFLRIVQSKGNSIKFPRLI
jgi:hypothetical protein